MSQSAPGKRVPTGRAALESVTSLMWGPAIQCRWPARARCSRPMAHDVQDVAVRCANEEAAHSPRLVLQRVDDLIATLLRIDVGSVDIVYLHADNGGFWCRS